MLSYFCSKYKILKMKKLLVVLSLGLVLAGCEQDKTAYVDTSRLIQEYSEMQEVEADFTQRSESLKRELDSAAQAFQQEVRTFQEEMENMSEAQRQQTQNDLMQKQQMLQQQQQMRSGALRQESDQVVDSIIMRVRGFVEAYGEENDYKYIFGSNESANIMYAEEGLDITEEVLEELNASRVTNQ